MKALVVGSADCVWDDLAAVSPWDGVVIAVNRAAIHYPGRVDHWATLHPENFAAWKAERAALGGNTDMRTWARLHASMYGATDRFHGWGGGTSGLYAASVAILGLRADEVILCGVPIEDRPHFDHDDPWPQARTYRGAWQGRELEMRGKVFSMSGWTRELLGPPPIVMARVA